MRGRSRLALTHARLTQWRAQHGGRGIPVPEELWAEVVKVARVEGAGTTARALRLDRARLEALMAPGAEVGPASGGFVELDAGRLGLSPRTVVRFHGRDGERIEVELVQPPKPGRNVLGQQHPVERTVERSKLEPGRL
jgi:hypothetical protein